MVFRRPWSELNRADSLAKVLDFGSRNRVAVKMDGPKVKGSAESERSWIKVDAQAKSGQSRRKVDGVGVKWTV